MNVLDRIEKGDIELISSTVLELEIARIPLALRREHGEDIIGKASMVVIVDETIEKRAELFTRQRMKPMDALHLAAAESARVDYFCTCDDAFLRRAKGIIDLHTVVVSPLELIEVLVK